MLFIVFFSPEVRICSPEVLLSLRHGISVELAKGYGQVKIRSLSLVTFGRDVLHCTLDFVALICGHTYGLHLCSLWCKLFSFRQES